MSLSFRLLAVVPVAVLGASASGEVATAQRQADPMRFFEGRTEGFSTVNVMARKRFSSRTHGRGEIGPDGVLSLVQRVYEDGKAPFDRRWRIRKVASGRYSGTMSEAVGPVVAQEIAGRYRFRFKMKGNLSIEQWLTPLPGGKAARSTVSIRKLGLKVGHSEGTIRKL